MANDFVVGFENITAYDVDRVGGKNASLGEMIAHLMPLGIRVPDGFAVTTDAFHAFLAEAGVRGSIHAILSALDTEDIQALSRKSQEIRESILALPFPIAVEQAITRAYDQLCQKFGTTLAVAVRSSATAEDLPEASFAGQQETFLNVCGLSEILKAIKRVFASLFTDRAIAYRAYHQYSHENIGISVGIQQMIRSDCAVSGVMFTLDTESGFNEVVLMTASYGLGELIVQGGVNPDEFYISKAALLAGRPALIRKCLGDKQNKSVIAPYAPGHVITVPVLESDQKQFSLTDAEIELLAHQALCIEKHYGKPMDIEWAKDGLDGELYIVQARPETVKSRSNPHLLERAFLKTKGPVLTQGRSVGQRIGRGHVKVILSIRDREAIQPGDILVTDMTDPDWEPIMKRVAGIVTNRGGRTCHAAIIARELGVPAVVGCGTATQVLQTGQPVTVSCAEGDVGYVYSGLLDYEIKPFDCQTMPDLPVKMMMIIGNPERAFDFQSIPNAGVGLVRLEFMINQIIGIHPKACLEFDKLGGTTTTLQQKILERIAGYSSPVEFYTCKLAEGIATLASAFWPKPVVVRLSDFKSNEYANLLGGAEFEPQEENPMLGFRGALRYLAPSFKACFILECEAIRKVREIQGFTNVEIMVPFVRTPVEAKNVIELLAEQGLRRGENGLRITMMCEIPSNALLAKEFLAYFDGFSIGSNDLTQLTLGLDRDSGLVSQDFDERNLAVTTLIQYAIQACREAGKTVGICGQGPSDYPDFARWLMEQGVDSISLNPDSVVPTWLALQSSG